MNQTLGASLREARERKGISLRQIATATKISVAALQSLERDDFAKLPGGIFSRAFVRSYAIEVGLDPDETVQRFLEEYEGEPRPLVGGRSAVVATPRPASTPKPAVVADLTPESDFESRQRMASVVFKLVAVSVPIAAAILYFGARDATAPRSSVTAAPPPAAQETPQLHPALSHPAGTGVPQSDIQSVPTPDVDSLTLEVAASGDCWAKLTADGTVVVSRLLKAGERETRAFHDVALLQVGDASACAILINGRAARPLGSPRQVREVRITRDNYTGFLP
jgi:cytoskeleton protein RodZ